jgi:hypothetical protein
MPERFPYGRIIMPEYRREFLLWGKGEQQKIPAFDEQRLREFQELLEQSLHLGLVVRIVTVEPNARLVTTGIVKKVNTKSRGITVQTIEGPRLLDARRIVEITL